jgi:prepilin-type N-terminal cleavage/methylation domain-containing protein
MLSLSAKRAFTLIELLVVIAIIAILSVVVILTLNPAQILMSSRDSGRISDMSTLNSALGVYLAQGGTSLGSGNTVYVSIPDPVATTTAGDQCQGLGLIALPPAYAYHCAASSTYRNNDGTGWIPVNFSSLATGAPLSQLPIDPINTSSSRDYYTYNTNGSNYEVTSVMESSKYKLGGSNDVIGGDGGALASVYEKGSKLGLEPLDYGDTSLIGLWSFSEGSSSVAYDYSGNNATGSWQGTAAGTNGYYSAGKIGPWAGAFNGGNDRVVTNIDLGGQTAVSMTGWFNIASTSPATQLLLSQWGGVTYSWYLGCISGSLSFQINTSGGNVSSSCPPVNIWHFIAATYNGSTQNLYIDGASVGTYARTGAVPTGGPTFLIGSNQFAQDGFNGFIDDARAYTRALSASEIAAMYAGGK